MAPLQVGRLARVVRSGAPELGQNWMVQEPSADAVGRESGMGSGEGVGGTGAYEPSVQAPFYQGVRLASSDSIPARRPGCCS